MIKGGVFWEKRSRCKFKQERRKGKKGGCGESKPGYSRKHSFKRMEKPRVTALLHLLGRQPPLQAGCAFIGTTYLGRESSERRAGGGREWGERV